MLVLSTFSVKMLSQGGTVKFGKPISGEEALSLIRERAAELQPVGVGHPGAAKLLTSLLNREVTVDRSPVTLSKGDKGFIVLPQGRIDPGAELSDEELRQLLVCYEFEVLE